MRRSVSVVALSLALAAAALAQDWLNPPYETQALFPRETSPGQYQQVSEEAIQALAGAGWELVSVVQHVLKNEERGPGTTNRPLVTQAYPAYFFKRLKRYGDLYPPYQVTSLFPPEVAPASYRQVDQQQIQNLAAAGWELVSVVPFVMKNEERGSQTTNRPLVTQTYPAYFLRRIRR
jgi:hypothetical protein